MRSAFVSYLMLTMQYKKLKRVKRFPVWGLQQKAKTSAVLPSLGNTTTFMEIWNAESTLGKNAAQREQQSKNLEKEACFIWYKFGFRPCKNQTFTVNNVDVQEEDEYPSIDSYSNSEI